MILNYPAARWDCRERRLVRLGSTPYLQQTDCGRAGCP